MMGAATRKVTVASTKAVKTIFPVLHIVANTPYTTHHHCALHDHAR